MFYHLVKLFIILLVTLNFQNVYGQSSLGYVEGEVIIKFKDSPDDSSVRQSLSGDAGNLTLQGVSGTITLNLQNSFNNFSMQHYSGVEGGQSTEEIIEQIENHPDIEYIEPNYIISKTNTNTASTQSLYSNPDSIFAEAARNAISSFNNEMVKLLLSIQELISHIMIFKVLSATTQMKFLMIIMIMMEMASVTMYMVGILQTMMMI